MTNERAAALCLRWQESRDETAITELLAQYEPLCNGMARRLWDRRWPHWRRHQGWIGVDDLVNWARWGVVIAADGYRTDGGTLFSTYCWDGVRRALRTAYTRTCGQLRNADVRSMDAPLRGTEALTRHDLIGRDGGQFDAVWKAELWAWAQGALPERQRAAVERYYRYGYSDKETGQVIGVSMQAAQQNRMRGVTALAEAGQAEAWV